MLNYSSYLTALQWEKYLQIATCVIICSTLSNSGYFKTYFICMFDLRCVARESTTVSQPCEAQIIQAAQNFQISFMVLMMLFSDQIR